MSIKIRTKKTLAEKKLWGNVTPHDTADFRRLPIAMIQRFRAEAVAAQPFLLTLDSDIALESYAVGLWRFAGRPQYPAPLDADTAAALSDIESRAKSAELNAAQVAEELEKLRLA